MGNRIVSAAVGVLLLSWTSAATAAPPLYSDNFNRADGPLGSAWEESPFGTLPTISSNQACVGPTVEGVAFYASTFDSSTTAAVSVKVSSTTVDSLKFGIILAQLLPTGPSYFLAQMRNDGAGHYIEVAIGDGNGQNIVQCTSSQATLFANSSYTLTLEWSPGGRVLAKVGSLNNPNLISLNCDVGARTPDRIVILSGRDTGTGTACFDDFTVFGVAGPSCSDGIQNGSETGVDCGGSCSACGGAPTVTPTVTPTATTTLTPTETQTVTSTPTSTPTPTMTSSPLGICPATPASGCATPLTGKLAIAGGTDPAANRLAWKWGNTPTSAPVTDFGDPLNGTTYGVCIYGDGALIQGTTIDAGGTCGSSPCWKGGNGKGFVYKNKTGNADGITSLSLKLVGHKANIRLKGMGSNLDQPLPVVATTDTRVQLVKSSGAECWETVFPSPAVKSTSLAFEDRLP